MANKKLLELRKRIKSRKPKYVRQRVRHYKKLPWKWHKPSGTHSKMRERRKGHMKRVCIGYNSPREVKFLHRSGLRPVVVNNVFELNKLNPKTDGAIISAKVGARNKIVLLDKAKEMGLRVLNIKDADSFKKKIADNIKSNKDKRKSKLEKKTKKPKESPKNKDGLSEKLNEDEKTEEEKKEKDKVLTKRQ